MCKIFLQFCAVLILTFSVVRASDYFQVKWHDDAIAINNQAVQEMDHGDFDKALAEMNKAISINPELAYLYSNRATCEQQEGAIAAALADYTKAISFHTRDMKIFYFDRAECKADLKDFSGALTDVNCAIAFDPKYGYSYMLRSHIFHLTGASAKSLADYHQAVSLDPKLAAIYPR